MEKFIIAYINGSYWLYSEFENTSYLMKVKTPDQMSQLIKELALEVCKVPYKGQYINIFKSVI